MIKRKYLNLFLLALFFTAFFVRILFIFYYQHPDYPDESTWNRLAIELNSGNGFTSHLRPPGFVFLLSFIYKIFGQGNITAVRIAQALLSSIQVVLLFLLSQKIFNRSGVSIIASLLLLIYPYSIFYTAHLISETLYSFSLALLFYFLYLFVYDKRNYLSLYLGSLALAIAALTKSTILIIVPFIIVWFIMNKLNYRYIIMFILFTSVNILPWSLYYTHKFGVFAPVMVSGSYLYQANNPKTLELEKRTRQLKFTKWYTEEYEEISKLSPKESDKLYRKKAVNFMLNNPKTVYELMKMRFIHFWRLYPITESKVQRIAALLTSGISIPLALLGILLSKKYWRKCFPIYSIILSFNIVHMVFICTLRYRVPLDQFFLILASFSIIKIIDISKSYYLKRR